MESIAEGVANYNFIFHTNKTKYIVQILGKTLNERKRDKMSLEFATLSYLNEGSFPYQVPTPIRSSSGKIMLKFGNKNLWVYKMIYGKTSPKMNKEIFKQFTQGLAIYHKKISSFKPINHPPEISLEERLCVYDNLSNISLRDEFDQTMINHLPFFRKMLIRSHNIFFGETSIIHGDYNPGNVLFKENQLVGVIDFDSVKADSKIKDISIMIDRTPIDYSCFQDKKAMFLEEYNPIYPLTKKESSLIIPALIKENCLLFPWLYGGEYKDRDIMYHISKKIVKKTQKLAEEIKWI